MFAGHFASTKLSFAVIASVLAHLGLLVAALN